jgi:hypothetical protein
MVTSFSLIPVQNVFNKKIILKLIVQLLLEVVGSMRYFSFPWPLVVPAHYLKLLARALNISGNFCIQEDSPYTQNLRIYSYVHHFLPFPAKCAEDYLRVKPRFLWQSIRLKGRLLDVLEYIHHFLIYPITSCFPYILERLYLTSLLYVEKWFKVWNI